MVYKLAASSVIIGDGTVWRSMIRNLRGILVEINKEELRRGVPGLLREVHIDIAMQKYDVTAVVRSRSRIPDPIPCGPFYF